MTALTPRHEAPADPCASHRSMGFHIDPCCPHCEAPAEDPVPAEWTGQGTDDDFFTPAKTAFSEEAPAEGAGERDYPAEFEAWWMTYRNANREKADYNVKKQIAFDAFYHGARSSAPEAREGEAVAWRKQVWVADGIGTGWLLSNEKPEPNHQPTEIEPLYTHPAPLSADHAELTRLAEAAGEEALGNLLAVIHGDGGHRALEVGTKQAALEAEKIVAGLFAAPSADKLREEVTRDQIMGVVRQYAAPAWCSVDRMADALVAIMSPASTPDALKGDLKP